MPDETVNTPTDQPLSDSAATLADSVINRLKKPKEDLAPLENGQFIKVQRAEMFELTCRELSAVMQKNPKHPVAAAYRRAVAQNMPTDKLLIEKIDLQGLLENKEVITIEEEGETEVEGMKMRARYQKKSLGDTLKSENTAQAHTMDVTPNQPGAIPSLPGQKSVTASQPTVAEAVRQRPQGKLGGPPPK